MLAPPLGSSRAPSHEGAYDPRIAPTSGAHRARDNDEALEIRAPAARRADGPGPEIERAWQGSIPAPIAAEFAATVKAAKERGPWVQQPDMAPGTAPRPPRPGHEAKPKKDDAAPRRRY